MYLCNLVNKVIFHNQTNVDMKFIDGDLIKYQNIYSVSKEYGILELLCIRRRLNWSFRCKAAVTILNLKMYQKFPFSTLQFPISAIL